MKKYSLLLSIFFNLLFTNSIFAQTENTQEIFVTGLAVPIASTKAGIGIATITQEQIQAINSSTFDEILRYVPGIVIRQNSAGKLTSLSMRGGNSGSTMIMIDGNPINDASSISSDIDLSSIPVDNIEKIEIIKGPVSASLGTSAMNGAINIITKKGGDKPVQAYTQLQSSLLSAYYTGNASLFGSKDRFDYRVNAAFLYDENVSSAAYKYGNTENDPDAMGHFSTYLGGSPVDNLNTSFYIDYTNRKSDLDNGGGANNDNPDYMQDTKRVSTYFKTSYLYNDIWEPSINLAYTYQDRIYGSSSQIRNNENDIFDGHTINLDFQNNVYIIDEFTLTAGLNYEYNQIFSRTASLKNNKDRNNYAGYLQGTITLFDNWVTVIAFRGQKDENMEFVPLYRASSVYDITAIDMQIKASVGNGALSPSLYQLYDPVFGNSSLKMQESFAYEVGFSNGLFNKMVVYGLSWFDNYYNNMIAYGSYIDDTNSIKTGFYNETKTHTRGIEADISFDPVKYINFGATYTWLQTFNIDGNPLARRPEHQVSAYINIIPIEKLKINIGFIYNGESVATIYENSNINDDYFLLNANISYEINDNILIYLKGTNLTNTEYEEIYGYGTKGIEIFAGLKAKI